MFLSRVELSSQAATNDALWRELAQPYGAHQALWRLFGRGPDQKRDFLFHAEETRGRPSFLALSPAAPARDESGLWNIHTKPFAPLLRPGQRLGFRLRASPVVRRADPSAPKGTRGVRHDVVMDRKKQLAAPGTPARTTTDLIEHAGIAWLERAANRSGFSLVETEVHPIGDDGLFEAEPQRRPAVRVDGYRQHRVLRRGENPITFSTLEFEGALQVNEPGLFLQSVVAGFGPQKAFGCGLMLLRRI